MWKKNQHEYFRIKKTEGKFCLSIFVNFRGTYWQGLTNGKGVLSGLVVG